ncbi:MAG: heme biosynthesis protein HemY [Gammaproteobacteria bacterium]|nr:MAG: heme biosynthesis protein HemY [Gammaproteobacteria bacterium]
MRKIFAIILVALLLGVGVVALIETDPGYILLAYGNYTLETSLWVGLVLLALFTLLIYMVLRLVYRLIGGQRSLVSWLGTRKFYHASRLTTRGLINFVEGNWTRARRQLLRGANNNDAPLINYLLAARASHRLHDPDKVSEYLGAARDLEAAAATAVALTRAEMQLRSGDYEPALATLEQAANDVARHPRVLELLREAYYGLADWGKLAALLPDLRKHKLLANEELQQLEREIYGQLLTQCVAGNDGRPLDSLRSGWQKMPADLKHDPQMLQGYVRLLIDHGDHGAAEKVILRAIKHQWDANLVRQYGYVQSDNVPRQLATAEAWLATHSDDAQLLLCLGRLSARDKLWGKARDYFESSYRLQHSGETCAELGRLLLGLGEPKVAAAYFREGLLMRESGLPELPMPEKTGMRSLSL